MGTLGSSRFVIDGSPRALAYPTPQVDPGGGEQFVPRPRR